MGVGFASPREEEREQKRKHLFPGSDPDGYRAEPGPYSCRSRHDLHHACRNVRELRSLLRAPCAPYHRTAAHFTSPHIPPSSVAPHLSHLSTTSLHYSAKKVSRLRRLTDYMRPNRLPTDTTLPRRDRSTTLAGYARSAERRSGPADAGPTLSRSHRTLHASCLKPGSTPSAPWLAMSTAPRRAASAGIAPSLRSGHDPCLNAHDVPLRGW
jgi:hypothetical protein